MEQPGFKIQPAGQTQILMSGSGETVHATVFAAAIGIDRQFKRYVRRLVARNDRFGVVRGERGRWPRFVIAVIIVEGDVFGRFETAIRIRQCSAAFTVMRSVIGHLNSSQGVLYRALIL